MNWILRDTWVRDDATRKPKYFEIKVYECKKCGSIYPVDSFNDKPQNITCLACYLSEGKKIE